MSQPAYTSAARRARGFTLIELAIALAILGLVAGGALMLISAQLEQTRTTDTERALTLAKDALIGFAQLHGRLPCPATASSGGQEDPLGGGSCNTTSDPDGYYGYLPAATLGIGARAGRCGSAGYLTDAWSGCIRYAVSRANANAATTTDGIKGALASGFVPNLRVCAAAGCAQALAQDAVAVVFSEGKNGAAGAASADESENADNDRDFVQTTARPAGSSSGEFDDLVAWLPKTVLISRMFDAGKLP